LVGLIRKQGVAPRGWPSTITPLGDVRRLACTRQDQFVQQEIALWL
jgi:hypothetical protein